jgi:hypothetical protein
MTALSEQAGLLLAHVEDLPQYRSLKSVRAEVSKAIAGLRYLSPNGKLRQSEQY